MKIYTVVIDGNEETFYVQPYGEDSFLTEYPDAILVEEISDTENKETNNADNTILNPDFRQDAAESADVVSDPQPALPSDSDSTSGNGSLELESQTETLTIDGEEVTREEYDKYSEAQKNKDKTEDSEFFLTPTGFVDFFGDIATAAKEGWSQGELLDPSFKLYDLEDDAKDEDIVDFINTNKKQARENLGSAEMQEFNKIYEEEGGGIWGFIKGVAYNPSTLPTMLVSSMAGQISSLQNNKVQALAAAGGAVGAAGGSFIPGVGTVAGGISGAMSGTMGAMETGLTFAELLQEEAGGLDKDAIRKVLNDPEKLADLKNRAAGRGLTIAAVEAATMGISKGVGGKLASAGFRMAPKVGAATTGAIEMIGGGTGEVAGRFVAGQEMDIADIGFETFASLGSLPVTLSQQAFKLKENINKVKINKVINASKYESITDAFKSIDEIDGDIINLTDLKGSLDVVENKVKKEVKDKKINQEEADEIVNNFKEIQKASKQAKAAKIQTEFRPEIVENLAKKNKLEKQIKEIDDAALSAPLKEEVDMLNVLLMKGTIASDTKGALDKVKKVAEGFKNVEIVEVDNDKAIEIASRVTNKTKESTGYGFIYQEDGVSKIVINKDEVETDGVVNTGAHEFLHFALKNIFKSANTEATYEALATSVGDLLASSELVGNTERFNQRLEGYEAEFEAGKISAGQLFEEQLVVLSEAMLDGEFDIKKNPSIMSNIKDLARRLLSTLGVKAKFNSDEDVLNFIKDYNRSISKGKFTLGQKRLIEEGAKGKLITKSKTKNKKESVKESMSPKMRRLLDRKESMEEMDMDPETRDNMLEVLNQDIQELKTKEAVQNKGIGKLKTSGPMTLEEADQAYDDALEAWEDAPDNDALLAEVEKALKEVSAAKERQDAGKEPVVKAKPEDKPTEKTVREKKDRSKKRYSLTPEAKEKIEPLIEKAQKMNKELTAKEKEINDAKIAKIEATPESKMSRTEQAIAIMDIKNNPTRITKPAELQRIETEILDRLEKPVGKAVTFFTKLLYDKIPKEAAAVIGGRDVYKTAAEGRIVSMVINEFKKNTVNRKGEQTINDVEDIIFNRGGLRLLTLATDLGVASASEGISQQFDNVSNNIGTEDTMFDEGGLQMSVEGKFRISSLLASESRYKQAMEAAVEFWETNRGNSPIESFSKLPGFTAETLGKMFDIPAGIFDKRISRSPNLNNKVYAKAMEAITKPYAVFKLTKDGITIEQRRELGSEEAFTKEMQGKGYEVEQVANQNILQTLFKFLPQLSAEDYKYVIDGNKGRSKGKSTGVPNNVVKLAFDRIQRNTTGVGNRSGELRRLTYKEVLNGIGGFVNEEGNAQVKVGINAKSPESQTFIGVMRTLNRMVANELSRSTKIGLDPKTVKDIAAGKNVLMESMKIDVSGINRVTPDMAADFNNWYNGQKNPSSIKQLRYLTSKNGLGTEYLGKKGNQLFKAELAYQFDKLESDATIEEVRDKLGGAWGKAYKWVYRDQGFNKALNKLNENSTAGDVRQFLNGFSRAWRNDNYQKVSTNKELVELIKEQGVDFEGLGFDLEVRGKKSYVYETIDGKRDFVNNPRTLLDIKNNAFNKIQSYGLESIKEVQKLQEVVLSIIDSAATIDDKIAAIEAMSIGQMGTLRRISYLRNVYETKGDSVLEHVTSLAVIKAKLKDYARGNVDNIQGFLDGLYLDSIPKEIDALLESVGDERRYTNKIKGLLRKYNLKTFDVVGERTKLKEAKLANNATKAANIAFSMKADTKRKGISVLDFDDTLARTNSSVLYTLPNGKKGKMTAAEFAKDGDRMTQEGVQWDFSEFSKVVDGKKGPLFAKTKELVAKFGNENVFILTARPANSKFAIHEFLSGLGLDIPLQNITGLADSDPQAKADWITEKAAEGYNDFFFADDHVKNVTSVNKALKKAKVKGKTVVADPNIKYSLKVKGQSKLIKDLVDVFDIDGEGQTLLDKATRTLDLQWNELYKNVTGVDPDVEFNEVEAQKLGDQVSKGLRARAKAIARGYLVESGADDFLGLLYRTLPKGKKGEAMMKLYEENLLKPFAIASREIEKARIKMAKRYRDIKLNNGISDKVLSGKVILKTESGKEVTYTSEDAVRVYMWRKQGIEVPGLSESNELDLAEHVKQSDELYSFTLNLMAKTMPEEFADPSKNWVTGSLKTDYLEGINKAKRKEALRFWSKGVETIFSESNINKLRVQHGTKFVAALQNSLERMKTGRNSTQSLDSDTKIMLQFISGAVGNIMFLNTRSAGLQMLSATNFMEAGDNTWGKSLKTMFTKMPTLAKDYKMLMQTDFLLDRRNALKMDVNDSDIARIAQGKGLQGKLARFLQWGYVFTQAADSRAIALGGAVYYRNKYDQLIKEGMDPKVAKEQALLETTEHAQSSQQSSRADKISKQQASTSGRLMLAFANTPMQYNRIVQKSYLDLVNGRGDKGKNLYNIAYYGLVQNVLFTVAQGAMLSAVYGTLFGDDEEEDKLSYDQKVSVANGVVSSWLRGMGIWGNGLNALKQTFMNIHKESKKKRPEYDVAAIKGLTSIMPAVGSKISKIYATTKAIDYNKDFLFDVNDGNVFKNYAKMPGVIALGQTAALFNVPLDRAQRKTANLIDAVNYAQSDLTKTAGLLFGHSLWTMQSDEEKEADYKEQKDRRKGIKKENKIKEELSTLTPEELEFKELKDLKKQQQIDSLTKYGLSKKQIRLLKYEEDRVKAIIRLQKKKRKNSLK